METTGRKTLLLNIEEYGDFADQLSDGLRVERIQLETRRFPDDERYLRVHGEVANRNIILVGGTHTDAAFLDMYETACSIVRTGARSLVMVVPYFGYSTMERATAPGEVVTAKTRARAFSAIPCAQTGNGLFLCDLHTDGIAHYFGDSIIVRHLSARAIISDCINRLGLKDPVIASTDAGRAKQVVYIANEMNLTAAFVYKRRTECEGLEMMGVNADVSGRPVVIFDDMVRTGGSLIQAAEAYLSQGATEVHAVTTHLVLASDALERIMDSPHLASLSGTDTHPKARLLAERGGYVAPSAPLFREALISRFPYLTNRG